ncbi:hypothetical protein P692DRAFT_20823139 [Suillus brevipes Sb2]|nr:hypothetical protein P692DRAFT_20823139 [Suillus brevipes Sb2]
MPPRAVASPKRKRSKRKGSDALKTGLPKKSRAADIAEVPSMVPLVSLGLAGAEAANDAPRRSGRPNAGTGGRNAQLEKIGLALQSKPRAHEHKGRTSLGPNVPAVPPPYSSLVSDAPDASAMDIAEPSLTLLQPGRRFGFAASNTTDFVHPGTAKPDLQVSENPYVTVGMKVAEQRARDVIAEQRARDAIAEQRARDAIAEQRARDAIAEQRARDAIAEQRARDAIDEQRARDAIDEKRVRDAITEKRARDAIAEQRAQHTQRSVFLEHNLDPALRQEDDTVRAQRHLRLLGSEEDSDSKSSSSSNDSDDSDDNNNKDPDGEADGEDDEEGENDDTVKSSQEFGWGEAGRRQKEHPGFSKDALPSQPPVARPLTPEFEFQYSRDEDDVVALTSLDKTSRNESSQGPQDILPGLQRQQSQHIETITLKPEDVLQRHHEKNRKPRLPDPDSLKLLNQETESSIQPSRAKRSKASGSGPTPDQLSWYGPHWKRFLEDAKAECRLQHALENPFPALVKNLPGSITEVLIATLVMWDRNGEQFEAGVWPEQKINMSRLISLETCIMVRGCQLNCKNGLQRDGKDPHPLRKLLY